jgi:hypothetical protein
LAVLTGFRRDFYDALTARRDELFELTDARGRVAVAAPGREYLT